MRENLVIRAPIFSLSGYGAHSRDIVLGLWSTGKYNISVVPTQWGGTSSSDNFSVKGAEILTSLVNNQIAQTAEFTFIHIGLPGEFARYGKRSIGITAGVETDRLPQGWAKSCNDAVDGIIVPSLFVKDLLLRGGVTTPIYVVGEGVDTAVFNPEVKCELPLTFDAPFNFLVSGQWLAHTQMNDRKGISHLISWFCDAFRGESNVGMVLKTHLTNVSSPDRFFARQRLETLKNKATLPKIHLIHGDMTDEEMAQLYKHPQIKALVSTTSGESWGRPLAEAAASDLPILVTGWSGHMDFLSKELVTLFDFEVKPVTQDNWVQGLIEPGSQWAYPVEEDVKRKMRRCVDGYSVAAERARALGKNFREKWSKQKTDEALVAAVEAILLPQSFDIPGTRPITI